MVTRTDIADAVADLFRAPPVTRAQLFEAAGRAPDPAQLLMVLQYLPDGEYGSLRDLWPHLSWVPVA